MSASDPKRTKRFVSGSGIGSSQYCGQAIVIRQSDLIPALFITLLHFSFSVVINNPNSDGVPGNGTTPNSASLVRIF